MLKMNIPTFFISPRMPVVPIYYPAPPIH